MQKYGATGQIRGVSPSRCSASLFGTATGVVLSTSAEGNYVSEVKGHHESPACNKGNRMLAMVTLGHSITVGLKTGKDTWFDGDTSEGTTWEKTYIDKVKSYLEYVWEKALVDRMISFYYYLYANDKASFIGSLSRYKFTAEEINKIMFEFENRSELNNLRILISAHFHRGFPQLLNQVYAHNGMRAQGESSREPGQNGALYFPFMLRNTKYVPDIVLTDIGVNDLRLDHRPAKVIFEGSQLELYNRLLQPSDSNLQTNNPVLLQKLQDELLSKGFTKTEINLFRYWIKHGNDKNLLLMALRIFNLNIRLGNEKTYAQISITIFDCINAVIEKVIPESLIETFERLKNCKYATFSEKYNAYLSFMQISKNIQSNDIKRYFKDWLMLHALNRKDSSTLSAAELLAEGRVEQALNRLIEHGMHEYSELLDNYVSQRISCFDVVEMITEDFSKLCELLNTSYCHLISPPFTDAYNIFGKASVLESAQLLEETWCEIQRTFPNTYCLPLRKYTQVYQPGEHKNADGLHWVDTNYKQASLPITLAILGIIYEVDALHLTTLIDDHISEVRSKDAKLSVTDFRKTLESKGYKMKKPCDIVEKCFRRILLKDNFSDSLIDDFLGQDGCLPTNNSKENGYYF